MKKAQKKCKGPMVGVGKQATGGPFTLLSEELAGSGVLKGQ